MKQKHLLTFFMKARIPTKQPENNSVKTTSVPQIDRHVDMSIVYRTENPVSTASQAETQFSNGVDGIAAREAIANLRQSMGSMKQEMGSMKQEMNSMEQRLSSRMDAMEERLTRVQVTLENETNQKIDVIGEGHDFLIKHLGKALQMEKKNERMELEILNLKMEVRNMGYDIRDLKRKLALV